MFLVCSRVDHSRISSYSISVISRPRISVPDRVNTFIQPCAISDCALGSHGGEGSMLTEQIINVVVLITILYGVGSVIVHAGKKPPECDKSCATCFWLYYLPKNEVACTDYAPLVRHISKSIIHKFHCSHHWFMEEGKNKSIGKGEINYD